MKRSSKLALILMILILTSGCVIKNQNYYDEVADTVISFYRDDTYNFKKIDKGDREILDEYLSTLIHKNQIINVSEFVNKELPSKEANSKEIFTKNDKCYMNYSDLKKAFDNYYKQNERPVIDAYYTVTCNGYYATMTESDFYPDYESTKQNPEHNYILLDQYKEDNIYTYIYRSTYNGVGLKLNIEVNDKKITNITTENVNTDTYLK